MYGPLVLLGVWDKSYSHLSLCNGMWAYMTGMDNLVWYLYINQLAIITSFHFALIYDKDVYEQFRIACKLSHTGLCCINFVIHILPAITYRWYIQQYNIPSPSPHTGIVTLLYTTVWMCKITKGNWWILDHVYGVKVPAKTWYLSWVVCIGTHLLLP